LKRKRILTFKYKR